MSHNEQITEEQRRRCQENKMKALQRLQARRSVQTSNAVLSDFQKTIPHERTSMSHNDQITEEQKRRCQENKMKALQKLQARRSEQTSNANLSNLPKTIPHERTPESNSHQKSNLQGSLLPSVGNQPTIASAFGSTNRVQTQSAIGNTSTFQFQNSQNGPQGKKNTQSFPTSSPSSFYGDTTVVKFSLLSKDRFEADTKYNAQVLAIFKTVPDYAYDSISKRWSFPIGQHSTLVKALRPLRPHIIVGELPESVFRLLNIKKANVPEESIMTHLEPALASTLMDFQREGVRYAVSRGGRILLADDMGLGKTIQALAIASYYKSDWPLLIVCPSSMRFQWKEEILTHMPSVPPHHVYVLINAKDFMDCTTRVLITSYDLMVSQSKTLLQKQFGVVIMDESHHLKNFKTSRTKVATEIIKQSKRCILLSGTPVLSRPQELFCQLSAIRPNLFKGFPEFGLRYCDGKKERFGWNWNGSSNMQELSVVLKEAFMIRRLKSEVLGQLPPKRREVVIVDIEEKKKLKNLSEFGEILKQEGLKGIERKACMLEYFSETSRAKTPAICQFVSDTIDNDEKFLVFAHHSGVLNAICTALEEKKKQYIRIDGKTSSENRKKQIHIFQTDPACLVAVLSIRAASTGLTLTAAKLVVFAELFWNPGDLMQAEDRVHRIGQHDSVLIQYLIAHDTVDDHIWPMIRSKLELLNQVGLSKDTFENTEIPKKKEETQQKDILSYFGSSQTPQLEGVDWSEFEIPM